MTCRQYTPDLQRLVRTRCKFADPACQSNSGIPRWRKHSAILNMCPQSHPSNGRICHRCRHPPSKGHCKPQLHPIHRHNHPHRHKSRHCPNPPYTLPHKLQWHPVGFHCNRSLQLAFRNTHNCKCLRGHCTHHNCRIDQRMGLLERTFDQKHTVPKNPHFECNQTARRVWHSPMN